MLRNTLILASLTTSGLVAVSPPPAHESETESSMELGSFSVSLAVEDLNASLEFYRKLGFAEIGGGREMNYLILQNGTTTIGLFQGMFEDNILTFNPGWNHRGEALDDFRDVREIQRELRSQGIEPVTEAEESTDGPASFVIVDPDGNMILFDQHVPKPE